MPKVQLSDAERATLKAAKERLNQEARENFDNPEWRRERAAEMTEVIYRGFENENLLQLMTTLETVDFQDRVFIKEVRGLKAFWTARGGTIQTSTLRENVVELQRMTIGFKVEEFIDKILTNFADTQTNIIDLATRRMDAAVNQVFFKLLQQALPSAGSFAVQGSGLSVASLNAALTAVRDEAEDDEVVIVGRATMTDQIMNGLTGNGVGSGEFVPETQEDIMRTGLLGTYRGAKIVKLKNYKDDTNTPYFPQNEMYVIATDASRAAFFGSMRPKEELSFEDYWKYSGRQDYGQLVHRPQRIRRFIDTSQPAYTVYPGD